MDGSPRLVSLKRPCKIWDWTKRELSRRIKQAPHSWDLGRKSRVLPMGSIDGQHGTERWSPL